MIDYSFLVLIAIRVLYENIVKENSIDKENWNKECCNEKWNLNHIIRCLKCGKTLREHRKFPKNIIDSKQKSHTDDTVDTK